MSEKTGWRDPSNIMAALAGILSLISLGVSVRSCTVSDKSLELATTEFRSQRSIILGGTVASDGNSLELKSLDSAIMLQQAYAIIPSEISRQEWPILPPENRLHVVVLRLGLQDAIERQIGRESGKAKVSLEANVPVVITSLFTAKGDALQDTALYRVMYGFVLTDDTTIRPEIQFRGLIYVQRLTAQDDPRQLVDQLWSQTSRQISRK